MAWPAALVALLLAGCGTEGLQPREPVSCSQRRLDIAAAMYEDAKELLAEHYTTRNETNLQFAYYASRDAVSLARSIDRCFDFNDVYKADAVNLIKASLLLQKMTTANMRDPDPGVAQSLLQQRYREVFKNDIN